MLPKQSETICPRNQQEWRQWLQQHHRSGASVWLIYYKKKSGKPTLNWSQAVDEALCFGWIDSTARPIDNEKYMQFFCRRKPSGVWSKVNKGKVQYLIANGLMTKAGFESIETAKQNGSWAVLDEVEELVIPQDLQRAFEAINDSLTYFLSLSKSVRKSVLQWVALARRPETRQKRMSEIAELAGKQMKPKQFR